MFFFTKKFLNTKFCLEKFFSNQTFSDLKGANIKFVRVGGWLVATVVMVGLGHFRGKANFGKFRLS